ncbi:3-hydroxyacyl-CoA dehydrogenase NAD-binding domain-containing protein [Brucella sp. BE17]|uniref:3-hydroxyacyl-CoA dehydrogenase NAD-binding domain-containing protein n=1 Tax=Brucella sp. BE17 TaxID=3142977 RepID=UPI0031BAA425
MTLEAYAIKRVAVIGCGTIGASWTALFLANGLDVIASELRDDAEFELRATVASLLPTLKPRGPAGQLTFTTDIAACCRDADFVQENVIEREAAKIELMARMDAALRPNVVIASSSSAITVSVMQSACVRPGRVVLGHPFNPPHLIPLVEIVGGAATESWALDKAEAFYASLGKTPIRLRKEIFGHVANRLQAAIFREAIHLLEEGVASAEEIDTAVTDGPGLRWALMGPFLTYHLAGGENGIRGFMKQFSPMQQRLWSELGQPVFDEALQMRVAATVETALGHRSMDDIRKDRDRRITALLKARSDDI